MGAGDVEQLRGAGYRVLNEIGHGGFGTVYLAEQVSVGREVALKVLSASPDEWERTRFGRECKAMGRLSWHPHIVVVYDAGVTPDGQPYISMEYLPGGNLAEAVRASGAMSWEAVLSIGVQLSGALAAAHANGVLHRDVKPANVLQGNFGEVKLTDFGIARLADSEITRSTGEFTATIAYTAPEVLNGDEPSEQSDVYSLGAMLFALLTGRPAFTAQSKSPLAIVKRVLSDPVPDLRGQGVPSVICDEIEAAMQKAATDRPVSAEAFGNALQTAQRTLGVDEDRLVVASGDARRGRPKPTVPATPSPADEDDNDSGTIPRLIAAKAEGEKSTTPEAKETPKAAFSPPDEPPIAKRPDTARKAVGQKKAAATKKPPATKTPPATKKSTSGAKATAVTTDVASPENYLIAPAVVEPTPRPGERSRQSILVAAVVTLVAVIIAIAIGSEIGLRTRDDNPKPLRTTTTVAITTTTEPTATTAAFAFAVPAGAADTFVVSGVPTKDPRLAVREAPGRDQRRIGDLLNGSAGIRVTGDEVTTPDGIRWAPIDALVYVKAGVVENRAGFVAAKYLHPAAGFAEKSDAIALINGFGFEYSGDDIWKPDQLSGVVGTAGGRAVTFFFADGIYVGADDLRATHTAATVLRAEGGRAIVAYNGDPKEFAYVLDRVPIRAE